MEIASINVAKIDPKVSYRSLPIISMPLEIYAEIFRYVEYFNTECSGMGLVERINRNPAEYRITELFFPERQTNHGAHTEFESDVVDKIMTHLIKEGKDPSKLRMHWHSHVNMGTFHSSEDIDNYKVNNNGDYFISLVVTKSHEVLGRVDIYSPFELAISGIPVYVFTPQCKLPAIIEENIKKVEEFNKTKVYEPPAGFGNNNWNWDNRNKARKQTREKFNVSYNKAIEYEECKKPYISCLDCKDKEPCKNFMEEFRRLVFLY